MQFQNGTANISNMSRTNPYAFTEQGVAMLSSVLKTDTADIISINIMRTFIVMKNILIIWYYSMILK